MDRVHSFSTKIQAKEIYEEKKTEIGNILIQFCEWNGVDLIF